MYDIAPHMVQEMKHAVTSENRLVVRKETARLKSPFEKMTLMYQEKIDTLAIARLKLNEILQRT
jgi:hypothetical protein